MHFANKYGQASISTQMEPKYTLAHTDGTYVSQQGALRTSPGED